MRNNAKINSFDNILRDMINGQRRRKEMESKRDRIGKGRFL